jgi:hypothetical protein
LPHIYPAGKYSVPVLWDKKEGVIVNNESSDILHMFNASFNNIAKNPGLDLYPEPLMAKIDEVGMTHHPGIDMCPAPLRTTIGVVQLCNSLMAVLCFYVCCEQSESILIRPMPACWYSEHDAQVQKGQQAITTGDDYVFPQCRS